MIYDAISKGLHAFLANQSRGKNGRLFYRLDDFDEESYKRLLEIFRSNNDKLNDRQLWVYTTEPISGYEEYVLEQGKSPTWYRNNVPKDHVLVLIFNQDTSDAQSLQYIYPVTANLLITEGLDCLMDSTFANYQLSPEEAKVVKDFLGRVNQKLFQPQLHSLIAFLCDLDKSLSNNPGLLFADAVAGALPYLGLFRCRELVNSINTVKGDRLLRDVFRATRLGEEVLDENQLNGYLGLLKEDKFDDETPTGHSPKKKIELLRSFLTDVLMDREKLSVLQLDWAEVAPILHKKARRTKVERLQELEADLSDTLEEQQIKQETLSESIQDVLSELASGNEPDEDSLGSLLDEYGSNLPKSVRNRLRRLRGTKKYESSDFIEGVTYLSVEMLSSLSAHSSDVCKIQVKFPECSPDSSEASQIDAMLAFRTLYGHIDNAMPNIHWRLEHLWDLIPIDDVQAIVDEGEQEKLAKVSLSFLVLIVDKDGNELDSSDLIWLYRSDGPAAATLENIRAEVLELSDGVSRQKQLRIPIYATCPEADKVGTLDLRHPVASLGAWYRDAIDLRLILEEELRSRTSPENWVSVEDALKQLEMSWACFIETANKQGVLAADLHNLLRAYQNLLEVAACSLQKGGEASYGFRVLTQLWIVGPSADDDNLPVFEEWAVVPFLHPIKLRWWRKRAEQFNDFMKSYWVNIKNY